MDYLFKIEQRYNFKHGHSLGKVALWSRDNK